MVSTFAEFQNEIDFKNVKYNFYFLWISFIFIAVVIIVNFLTPVTRRDNTTWKTGIRSEKNWITETGGRPKDSTGKTGIKFIGGLYFVQKLYKIV